MSGLLPEIVRDAVASKSVSAAAESFGVVAFVVLVVLLLQREVLRIRRAPPDRLITHSAFIAALLIAVTLTMGARIVELAT